jgi:hypothetical protein
MNMKANKNKKEIEVMLIPKYTSSQVTHLEKQLEKMDMPSEDEKSVQYTLLIAGIDKYYSEKHTARSYGQMGLFFGLVSGLIIGSWF